MLVAPSSPGTLVGVAARPRRDSTRTNQSLFAGAIVALALSGVATTLDAGAIRVELCQALGFGGLTPSAGLIEATGAAAQLRH